MILKARNLGHNEELFYQSQKVYFKYQHLLEKEDYSFIDDLYHNDIKKFQLLFYSIFFFNVPEFKTYMFNSNYKLNHNISTTLSLCALTRNQAFFKKIIRQDIIEFPEYRNIFRMINNSMNFEYAEYLLEIETPIMFKNEFFLDCCYKGKAKTVEFFLNNYSLNENIINQGLKTTIDNKKTGTIKKIINNSNYALNIDHEFIDHLLKINDFNIIKSFINHKDFNKDKYALYLLKIVFEKYKNSNNKDNYYNFLYKIMFENNFSEYLPSSIVLDFKEYRLDNVLKFLFNYNKIQHF